MCGSEFIPAIPTIQIIAPIILFIGLSNLVGLQVLYSQGQEKIVIISTLCGAIVNCFLNFILIPHMAQNGAAIATVVAEFCVTAIMLVVGRKYIPFSVINNYTFRIVLFSIVICAPIPFVQHLSFPDVALFMLEVVIATLLYVILLALSHNEFLYIMKEMLVNNKTK